MASAESSMTTVAGVQGNSKSVVQIFEWEETKYTKLPGGWSRLCREVETFLHNIGLGIIMATYRGTFQNDYIEPKKVSIHRSRLTAFFKSLIHVVPVSIAIFELILNWKGYYWGISFSKQSWYQLAAKAHEILIDASLSSIVLSYIRLQLTSADGLPFGAFLGGLQFLTISYLWSRELWSSMFSAINILRKRVTFLLLIIACGIIAATAGPSSATFLIPRLALWPGKSTYVLINGTAKDIWVDRLDPKSVPSHCSSIPQDQTQEDPLCPGANWYNLLGTLAFQSIFADPRTEAAGSITSSYNIPGPGDLWTPGTIGPCPMDNTSSQNCGDVVPAAVSSAAFNNTFEYYLEKEVTSFIDIYYWVEKDFYSAKSAVRCLQDTISGPRDTSPLRFPQLFRTENEYRNANTTLTITDGIKADFYSIPGNISDYRLTWVSLPDELTGNLLVGAVLLNPRSLGSGSLQNITTCTLAAGWGTSSISTRLDDSNVYSSSIDLPTSFKPFLNDDTISAAAAGALRSNGPIYGNVSGYAYPQRPIQISPEWLAYLNPVSTLTDGTNGTVINAYMSLFPPDLTPFQVATVLTGMLEGGLTISGWSLPWQELPNGPVQCTDCTILEVKHAYYGWLYNRDGTSIKLATAVMITYCALAVGHMFYLGSTGISSGCWDSAAEIVALAMNSASTQHLQNTCSGIIGMKPFKTRVRILATANAAGEHDHLELVFGEKTEAQGRGVRMEFNKEYGVLEEKVHRD